MTLNRTVPRMVAAAMTLGIAVAEENPTTLRLPSILSDHLVLQQDLSARIWGWAPPHSQVQVLFADCQVETTANEQGRWQVMLPPLGPSETGRDLIVKSEPGFHKLVVHDVLVGELWLCSGQSNMALGLAETNGEEPVLQADDPSLRLFQTGFHAPQYPAEDCEGKWVVCDSRTVGTFSAVGYYFGRELRRGLQRPVGMIQATQGATSARSWISRNGLMSEPSLQAVIARFEAIPKDPQGWDPHLPTGLYNGKIHPLIPLTLRGVIWYQGESDSSHAFQYRTLFPALIQDWRKAWGVELPFYFVQVTNFGPPLADPGDETWAELREAQTAALRLPKTEMVAAIDLGEADNIHPTNKVDVAKRLSLVAFAKTYELDRVFSGPRYQSYTIEGDKIRIHFDHIGDGLVAKDYDLLKKFEIAGPDRQFVWADAVIDGETVVASSTHVTNPVAVRYAWANNPEGCNLYNRNGLPAFPFRTDNWPGITDEVPLEAAPIPKACARISAPIPEGEFLGNVLDVKLSQAIERPWVDVKTDGYVYAPEQEVMKTGETHIWLPFGNVRGVYYALDGLVLTDTAPMSPASLVCGASVTDGSMTLKFRFDKPIKAFRFCGGRCEFNPHGAVMGFEYRVDGKDWLPLCKTEEGGLHEHFPKPEEATVSGLSTQTLLLRFFIRETTARTQLHLRMGGDPQWGDASYTFHAAQGQLWVSPAE